MEIIQLLLPEVDENTRLEVLMSLSLQGLEINAIHVRNVLYGLKNKS